MQKATLNLLQAFCLRLEIQAYVPRFPFILLFTTTTKSNLKTQWRKSIHNNNKYKVIRKCLNKSDGKCTQQQD